MGSIYYHGTNEKNAKIIQREGFKPGTYFTWDLHSALMMGGLYVFAIYLKDKDISDYWEWRNSEIIKPEKILYLRKFDIKCIYDNKIEKIRMKKLIVEMEYPEDIFCENCEGKGQMNEAPEYGGWGNAEIEVCTKCGGFGRIRRNGQKYGSKISKEFINVKEG